jgi:hemolysin III
MRRRPDPWPRSFGYHEVWHSFTIVAAVLHFAVIATVVS